MRFLADYPEMKLVLLYNRKHPYIFVERVNFEAFFKVNSWNLQRLYLNSTSVSCKLAVFYKDNQTYLAED